MMADLMATPPCSPDVKRARIDWCRALLRAGPDPHLSYLAKAQAYLGLSKTQAWEYLAAAKRELGDALDLSDDDFDAAFVQFLFDQATDAETPPAERRRTFETLARFKGRFKQIALADALASAPPSADLSDPAVLAAALALDAAASPPAS